jgi:hypothetical protein
MWTLLTTYMNVVPHLLLHFARVMLLDFSLHSLSEVCYWIFSLKSMQDFMLMILYGRKELNSTIITSIHAVTTIHILMQTLPYNARLKKKKKTITHNIITLLFIMVHIYIYPCLSHAVTTTHNIIASIHIKFPSP